MDYNSLKKLDEESLEKLQEGSGPADKCICNLFTTPDDGRKSIGASIRKAFGSIGKKAKHGGGVGGMGGAGGGGGRSVTLPLGCESGKFGICSTRRIVQRKRKCGKCACDKEKFVLKDSDLSIRITTPDISTICPCPSDCLGDKARLQDNIKVTIEYAKTPDVPSLWNTKSTKEQVGSTLGQTEPIQERLDENKSVEEIDSLSTIDVKEATEQEETAENDGQEKSQDEAK